MAKADTLTIVGSTCSKDFGTARIFRIDVPAFPVFFSGTGDMFAALMLARLREAVFTAGVQNTSRWQSPDEVPATELPLAKAAEKVCAGMHAVLSETYSFYRKKLDSIEAEEGREGPAKGRRGSMEGELAMHLRRTKASEVRVIQNVEALKSPPDLDGYRARAVEGVGSEGNGGADKVADQLGVVHLGVKSDEKGGLIAVEKPGEGEEA